MERERVITEFPWIADVSYHLSQAINSLDEGKKKLHWDLPAPDGSPDLKRETDELRDVLEKLAQVAGRLAAIDNNGKTPLHLKLEVEGGELL